MNVPWLIAIGAAATAVCGVAGAPPPPPPCEVVDFDDLAPQTAITPSFQPYAGRGVRFFGTCATPPACDPVIAGGVPLNAPSPGNALASIQGDPLQDACINIVFDTPQSWVRLQVTAALFDLNVSRQPLLLRALDSLGNVLGTASPTVLRSFDAGTGDLRMWWSSNVTFDLGSDCRIYTVQVCINPNVPSERFYIDNVAWGNDTSDPEVEIFNPPTDACVCDGNLTVTGRLCDPDGCGDVTGELRIRPDPTGATDTAGSPPWTTLGTFTNSFCGPPATMYTGTLPAAQYPEGRYMLELNGTNACGLDEDDQRVIYIDRSPPVATVSCPTPGMIVNGNLNIVGSVTDPCLTGRGVRWLTPSGGNIFVSSGTTPVSGVMGTVNTPLYPDGPGYAARVLGVDACGHTVTLDVPMILDNTPPIAMIEGPESCYFVCPERVFDIKGYVSDANLSRWQLDVWTRASGWETLNTGTGTVGNFFAGVPGVLGTWDQCNEPSCCYILRLRAWDLAGGCDGPANMTDTFSCGNLGNPSDLDNNGILDLGDVVGFINSFTLACPGCP